MPEARLMISYVLRASRKPCFIVASRAEFDGHHALTVHRVNGTCCTVDLEQAERFQILEPALVTVPAIQ